MFKAQGIGRFVAKPELKHTSNKVAVSEFTLAFNERRKVGDKLLEQAHFFDFVIWDKAAELVCKSFDQGDPIYIASSTPRQDKWETTEGQKRSRVVFRVDEFSFVPRQKNRDTEVAETTQE